MAEFAALLEALSAPRAYPHDTQEVGLVQTQISVVFLVGDFVYKVKKPVDFGFLDFTTLDKRRLYCQQEVALNSRLCPDTYLGVVAITQDGDRFFVEGRGTAVEYAVKMRYLPPERMMDRLLQDEQVTPDMLERVADKLTDFHRQAEITEQLATIGGLDTVAQNVEENFVQTEAYVGQTISPGQYEKLRDYSYAFLEENAALFAKRVKAGRIRDCHGDLHAAHICFNDGICIFDCIEFNDRFRYIDVANEVAFLAMDLDFHGRPDLSRHFVDAYVRVSGDRELLELLDFYKCYRAYVRGKVEGFKLGDPHISEEEKTRILAVARRYFELAESYTEATGHQSGG
jgi:aminoglycoside phosphotransferase family enzyme